MLCLIKFFAKLFRSLFKCCNQQQATSEPSQVEETDRSSTTIDETQNVSIYNSQSVKTFVSSLVELSDAENQFQEVRAYSNQAVSTALSRTNVLNDSYSNASPTQLNVLQADSQSCL